MSNEKGKVTFVGITILAFWAFFGRMVSEKIILPNFGKKTIAKTTDTSNEEYIYFKFCNENYITQYGYEKRGSFEYKGKKAKYYEITYWNLNPDVYKINLYKEIVDTLIISQLEKSNWKYNSN